MNRMIQELNSISRMAVIENAVVTEHLICDYINILKYRWNEEEKMVAAAKEIGIIKRSCELYQKTSNQSFVYKIEEDTDVKMVFVPHYTILSAVLTMLEKSRGQEETLHLTLNAKESNGRIKIKLLFEGAFPWSTYYEKIWNEKSSSYEDMYHSFSRWTAEFGENSWRATCAKDSLELCLYCH